jgi:replication protein O
VPDTLFDELLSELSGAELKVVLYIIRRTFGFKRQTDTISINQMLCGIKKKNGEVLDRGTRLSKSTLLKAIKELTDKKIILPTRQYDEKGSNMPTEYRLHIAAKPPQERGDDDQALGKESLPSSLGKKTLLGESQNFTKGLVKKLTPQGTGIHGTENNVNVNVNGDKEEGSENRAEEPKTDLRKLPDLEQDKAKTVLVAQEILNHLGDRKSFPFYYLVASKIPEREIYSALSSIKQSGANFPPKVFATRMKEYAAKKTDTRMLSLQAAMQDMRTNVTLH